MNIINSLLDVIDDPAIKDGFIVIWSDSAAFGICEKFVNLFFVISCYCR